MGVGKSRVAAVAAGAFIVVGLGAGGAVAGQMIGSQDIRNGSIQGADMARGSITAREVRNGSLNGSSLGDDTLGRRQLRPNSVGFQQISDPLRERVIDDSNGLSDVEADGAYPGTGFDLQNYRGQGANSTEAWDGDNGASLHTSWIRCAQGKIASGGGFSRFRDGAQADQNVRVVSSFPAHIDADGTISFPSIGGDQAHSFLPNGWVVEGYNMGDTALNVRPWVICAEPAG